MAFRTTSTDFFAALLEPEDSEFAELSWSADEFPDDRITGTGIIPTERLPATADRRRPLFRSSGCGSDYSLGVLQ